MNILSNINTRNRLLLGNGVIIMAIIAIVIVTYSNIKRLNSTQDEIINSYEITKRLIQIRSDENRMRTLLVEMVLFKEPSKQIELEKLIMEKVNAISKMRDEIKKDINFLQQDIDKYEAFEQHLAEYSEIRLQQLELTKSGKTEEVIAFIEKTVDPAWVDTRDRIYDLQNAQDKHRVDNLAIASSVSSTEIITLVTMGIGVILLSILIIGWMFHMLRIIFSEIKNGVAVLGTSASEILTTVTEVSTGATETATAVSETTVTMEEIRQTAMLAAQKAQAVLENSHRASEAAENGKEAVQQTIDGMNRINGQMKIISDSVIKLSEQNRSVGEITASVNDIADQSNLLAVNAAIEAAKAGEHGRGFTVVAQEIRSLAEQSKKATAQVKEILNEIQKGMNTAVAATEQGIIAVENGNNLARQSGEMIEILSETVNDAAQSVIQISTSNQQQMSGMDQIVPAMENIKQASEQNVTGVRQTQSAAHNLNDLGQKLKAVIDKFKL